MGSVAAARRAGTRQANAAATISSRVTPAKINGSRELSVTHFVAILSNATLSRRPAASPAPRLAAVEMSKKGNKTAGFGAGGVAKPNSLVGVARPEVTRLEEPTRGGGTRGSQRKDKKRRQ